MQCVGMVDGAGCIVSGPSDSNGVNISRVQHDMGTFRDQISPTGHIFPVPPVKRMTSFYGGQPAAVTRLTHSTVI